MYHPHPHIRKRKEPYPSARFWIYIVDKLVLSAGILGPIFTIPQILNIYISHDAGGVSPISWGAYMFLNIPWILYGLVHRERPIVITFSLWLFVNFTVFMGALIYR